MQPMLKAIKALRTLAAGKATLFALSDLHALLPAHREGAFKSVITRLEKRGELERICRGIYRVPGAAAPPGGLLAGVANRLRPHQFN